MTTGTQAVTTNKKGTIRGKKAMTTSKKRSGGYAVGYGKPPLHTRFRPGESGNPGGRPKRAVSPVRRARALALEEAYRIVTAGGADGVPMPAIQAIIRRQIALAMNGNGPAQRAIIAAVAAIEDDEAREAEKHSAGGKAQGASRYAEMSDTEAARRVAFLLRLTAAQDPEFRAELAPELWATGEASRGDRDAVAAPEGSEGDISSVTRSPSPAASR